MDGMVREPDRRISISGQGAGCGVGKRHVPAAGYGLNGLISLTLGPWSCISDLLCFAFQGSGQPLGHGPHQHLPEGTEAGRAAG